jgi:hypothetical protein
MRDGKLCLPFGAVAADTAEDCCAALAARGEQLITS